MAKRSFRSKSKPKNKRSEKNKLGRGKKSSRRNAQLLGQTTPYKASSENKETYQAPLATPTFEKSTSKEEDRSFAYTISQLNSDGNYLILAGSPVKEDELEITDASGVVDDVLFTNITSIEELELEGNGGYNVTLGTEAQEAGIREVELGGGSDTLDATAMTVGLEIEAGKGDDDITGGSGNDEIEGDRGADRIDLTLGGSDIVKYESKLDGSSVGLTGQQFTGFDNITGFTSGDDKIDIDYTYATIKFIAETPTFDIFNVDDVISSANTAVASDFFTAGRTVIFAINDGTKTGLYSGTIIDSDLISAGVQAAFSNVFMLASVTSPIAAGDIV